MTGSSASLQTPLQALSPLGVELHLSVTGGGLHRLNVLQWLCQPLKNKITFVVLVLLLSS